MDVRSDDLQDIRDTSSTVDWNRTIFVFLSKSAIDRIFGRSKGLHCEVPARARADDPELQLGEAGAGDIFAPALAHKSTSKIRALDESFGFWSTNRLWVVQSSSRGAIQPRVDMFHDLLRLQPCLVADQK